MKLSENFKLTYIIMSVMFIIFGACMIFFPSHFAYTLCYIIGGICLLHGIIRIIGYFSKDLYKIAFQFDLALGITSVLIGILFIFGSKVILSFVPAIIGLFNLLSGTLKIQSAIDAKKFGISKWPFILIGAVLSVLFGVTLILYSLESTFAVIVILGVTLVFDGIQNLFLLFHTVKY